MSELPPRPVAALPEPALGAPPQDVQALLFAIGLPAPPYFDAQQAAALQLAGQQWPALWRMVFARS